MKQNSFSIAKFYLDRADEFGYHTSGLYSNRAIVYIHENRLLDAIDELVVALNKDSKNAAANYMLAQLLLSKKNFGAANKYLKNLVDSNLETPEIARMYAAGLMAEGQFMKAYTVYNELQEKEKLPFDSLYNFIWILMKAKKKSLAQQVYVNHSGSLNSNHKIELRALMGDS